MKRRNQSRMPIFLGLLEVLGGFGLALSEKGGDLCVWRGISVCVGDVGVR